MLLFKANFSKENLGEGSRVNWMTPISSLQRSATHRTACRSYMDPCQQKWTCLLIGPKTDTSDQAW
jgi:hypothetical protein